MKTPIINTWPSDRSFHRNEHAIFIPKGTRMGERSNGQPYLQSRDSVSVGGGTYHLRGIDLVRVIPDEYVAALDDLDLQIRDLEQQRRELVAEAFRRGRPVKKSDCETLEERKARRAAEVKK